LSCKKGHLLTVFLFLPATTQNDDNQRIQQYKYIFSTNDDGWLVGGGEPGPPKSYKLAAADSAHVEIMRIGTYEKSWGGLDRQSILDTLKAGKIKIPHIMDPKELQAFLADPENAKLPVNWPLRFLQNQLFKEFSFSSRFTPGAFHSTIVRKAEFRSQEHRVEYFKMCARAIAKWKEQGPQPLQPPEAGGVSFGSGIYLFTDRNNISHKFEPNFLPPYDTPDKRQIIAEFLKEEWDEKSLSFKPVGAAWKNQQCGGPEVLDDKYSTCNVM
jgi:hypothetical protein